MTKKIITLVFALLFFAQTGQAQVFTRRNDTPTTRYAADLQKGFELSVDQYARLKTVGGVVDPTTGAAQSVIPISNVTSLNGMGAGLVGWQRVGSDTAETTSTTTVIKATAHIGRVGDAVIFTGGTAANLQVWATISAVTTDTFTIANALPATPANGDAFNFLRPINIGASPAGSNYQASINANIDYNTQLSSATGLLKSGTTGTYASGDGGVAPLAVNNRNEATLGSTNGRYLPIANNDYGAVFVDLAASVQEDTNSPVRKEDSVFADQNGVMVAGGVVNEAAVTFTSTSQDVAPLAVNRFGATLVALDSAMQVTAATGLLHLEDALAASADAGVFALSVRNQALSQLSSGDGDYQAFATGVYAQGLNSIVHDPNISASNIVSAQEDDAIGNAHAGILQLGIVNEALATQTATALDAIHPAFTREGVNLSNIVYDANVSTQTQVSILEDSAAADAQALLKIGNVQTATLTNTTNLDGDWQWDKGDTLGALWVRPEPNQDVSASLITCAGCTTTQTGSDQVNYSGKCANVVLDMTTVGTSSVTLEIDGKDVVSGKYYAILTGAAVVSNSTNLYQLCPGVTVAANAAVSSALPKTWRIKVTANNANAATYTVGASIIE